MTIDKSSKLLILSYCLTFVLVVTYYFTNCVECEAYWMHDASIIITNKWLLIHCTYLFLLPIIFVLFRHKTKLSTRIFLTHFTVAIVSISLLVLSLDKPMKVVDGVKHIFINGLAILGYYFLKLIAFIVICYIIFQSIYSLIKQRK